MAGVTKNNTLLASNVRSLSLKAIEKVLLDESEENKEFRKQLLLKLSGSILPRLNEHTGQDGGDLVVNIIKYGEPNKEPKILPNQKNEAPDQ